MRKLDNVHLCPEGSARYADALLTDMTSVFRLAPAGDQLVAGRVDEGPELQRPARRLPGRPSSWLTGRWAYEQIVLLMVRFAVAADLALAQLVPMLATTS